MAKLDAAALARFNLRNPGKEVTHHFFAWNPKPLEFERIPASAFNEREVDRYEGAVECIHCGMRVPQRVYDKEKVRLLIMRLSSLPDDGTCDENIVASVLCT